MATKEIHQRPAASYIVDAISEGCSLEQAADMACIHLQVHHGG